MKNFNRVGFLGFDVVACRIAHVTERDPLKLLEKQNLVEVNLLRVSKIFLRWVYRSFERLC